MERYVLTGYECAGLQAYVVGFATAAPRKAPMANRDECILEVCARPGNKRVTGFKRTRYRCERENRVSLEGPLRALLKACSLGGDMTASLLFSLM